MTANLNAKVREQLFRQRATGHPRRRLARGSTFQHIAQIARVVFQSTGQIGMTRPRPFDAARFLRREVLRLNRHHLSPVGPVFVFDHQRQRRAERQTMTNTAENLDAVLLDLHPRAAAIALLPPRELVIDLLNIDGHARGQTFDDRDQRATV